MILFSSEILAAVVLLLWLRHLLATKSSPITLKDYRYHALQHTEFSYILIIDNRQFELPTYLSKNGGEVPAIKRPL